MEKLTLELQNTWSLLQLYWPALVALLGTGFGVSVLTELVKRRIVTRKELELSKKAVAGILTVLAGAVTVAQYVITAGTNFPLFFGQHTTEVIAVAYSVYHFGGSSGYKKVVTTISKWKAIADALEAEKASVTSSAATVIAPSVATPPAVQNPENLLGQSIAPFGSASTVDHAYQVHGA